MKNAVSLLRGCATLAAAILLPLTALAADAPAAPAKFVEIPATPAMLKQLRQGGFSLYLRHGLTDNTRADRMPAVDLNDCSTQRPLTEGGRLLAASVGESIRKAGIPISEIRSSPLCRAKETTAAAFPGQPFTVDKDLMYTANMTDAQKAPIIANTRRLLAKPAAPGSNHLQVAHAPNLMDLIGYFPKEGTLVIFRPQGGERFEYMGSIPPGRWSELLH